MNIPEAAPLVRSPDFDQAVVSDPPLRRLGLTEAPLSAAQQRLWFLHQLQPDNPAYHVCHRIDWPEDLDPAVLARAVADLVQRHEVLRTRFPAVDGSPRQVIDPPGPVPVSRYDLRGLPEARATAELQRITAEAANLPFDLASGPLLRVTLVHLAGPSGRADRTGHAGPTSVVIVTQHHIITDGWSVGLLIDQLATCYRARHQGREPWLPQPRLQYADFAVWQRDWLAAGAADTQLAYWRTRLAGPADPVELPTDRPRGAGHRGGAFGHTLRFTVGAQQRQALVDLARRHRATLFMTLLAGFQTVLSRHSGSPVVTVTCPVTNRTLPGLEDLPGMFLNTLVLRADLTDEPDFAELMARTRESVLDAFDHQDLPFERLVEELAPQRDPGQAPFSPVMFTFNTLPGHATDDGHPLTVTEIDTEGSRAELALVAEDGPDGLRFAYEYDRQLFDPESVARLHGHLLCLLDAAATEPPGRRPGRPVGHLPVLTAAELAQLADWNDTARPYRLDVPVHVLVEEQARRTPEATALIAGQVHLSYAGLIKRAERLAGRLSVHGVGPGARVGVLLHRGPDLVVALLAVLRAGGAYVPLDPSYPADRLRHILTDAACPVLVSTTELAGGLADGGPALLDPERDGPEPTRDGPDPAGEVVAVGRRAAGHDAGTPRAVHGDLPAYVLYTSGSTGQPKGVVNTHRGLTNHTLWLRDAYGVTGRDTVVQKTPIGFDVSLWELLVPLVAGARLVLAEPEGHRDPHYLAGLVAEHRITMIHFVPSMLQAFLETVDPRACASLRQVLCSGEALPAQLQRRFFDSGIDAGLANLYGPTEAAVHVTSWACRPDPEATTVPIGHPVANCQAHVLDRYGHPVPVGVPGELYLGGVQVALGYLGQPGRTAERFVPDPFSGVAGATLYRTGDLVRRRADGTLEFLGRGDHQVKLRGFRIELGEVEAVLAAQPTVTGAVVLLREDTPGDPRLVAYLTVDDDAPTVEQLRTALGRSLPAYMVPQAFVVLPALPLSPNGKVDRRALAAIPPADLTGATTGFVAPRDEVEEIVAGLFADLLGCGPVGVRDNFFDLGGHSLLATRLAARIRNEFRVDLPLRVVFDTPTVESLAVSVVELAMAQLDPAELAAMAADGEDGESDG